MNTVLITGASSRYGHETARHFHQQRWRVFATMRRPEQGILPSSDRRIVEEVVMGVLHRLMIALSAGGSVDVVPEPKTPPSVLIVVWAFDNGEDGEMVPAWEPREMPDEPRVVAAAKLAPATHAAAIA